MKEFEAIDVTRVFGNNTNITSEEKITGKLDFVARPDGGAWLILPISVLIEKNEEHRKRGILEISPLDKWDLRLRVVVSLGKPETAKLLKMKQNEEIILIRKGWGKEWQQKIRYVS